jgi:hypothetical protein
MNVTLSVPEKTLDAARRRAQVLGKSVNQLVREYLEQLGGTSNRQADADEFERLSMESRGESRGWKFNRDELHERQ